MNDIEFLAHCRNDHQKIYSILLNLRRAESDWKRTLSATHKATMEYWQHKADKYLSGVSEESLPDLNFKSLMSKENTIWILS